MINTKSYSKLRMLLAIPLIGFSIVLIKVILITNLPVNYFVVIPYFGGVVLFVLNRKYADYIAFAIFIFAWSGIITFWMNNYFNYSIYWDSFYSFLLNKPEEPFFFLLSSLVLMFLLKNNFALKNK